jgi:pilus assembly protein CpaE
MSAPTLILEADSLLQRRLALVADGEAQDAIAAAFAGFGWPAPEAVDGDLEALVAATGRDQPPALVIVDIDCLADPAADIAALSGVLLPEARLLAVGAHNDVALYRAMLAAGAGDYLPMPFSGVDVAAAIRRLFADAAPALAEPVGPRTGRLVAVLGARGGCGASMVASSLAWAIANVQQHRSVLVDLDLHFGSAALTFGLEPGPGLGAMLAAPERVDATLVAAALQPAGERLSLIATATPLSEDMDVSPDAVAALLATVREDADWVVADLPHGLDAMARRLLRTADRVVLVAPPTLAGLRDAGRLATYITDLRAGGAPLLVVNGGNENADGMKQHLFEENLGEAVAAWVPTLPGPAAAAEAHGLPLAAVAGGVRGGNPFATLATLVTGMRAPTNVVRGPRWWPWRG